MLQAKLLRYKRTTRETLGLLTIGNSVFNVLEPPWRENKSNISCIPAGTYDVKYLAQSNSGKYKPCFHVTGVPARVGILMHNGNTSEHTKGCLLVGTRVGLVNNNNAVLNSRYALRLLVEITNKQGFTLEIHDGLVS